MIAVSQLKPWQCNPSLHCVSNNIQKICTNFVSAFLIAIVEKGIPKNIASMLRHVCYESFKNKAKSLVRLRFRTIIGQNPHYAKQK